MGKNLFLHSKRNLFIGKNAVEIREIVAPPPLELGSLDEVVIDCDYELPEAERGQLEMKWYFNGDPSPFLQWIPGGGRRPQLITSSYPAIESHIDLDFQIAEDNEQEAFRALKIMQPTIDLAGDYLCKVSTFENEDIGQESLIIYGKTIARPREKKLSLHHPRNHVKTFGWIQKKSFFSFGTDSQPPFQNGNEEPFYSRGLETLSDLKFVSFY